MSIRQLAKNIYTFVSLRLFKNKIGVLPNLLHFGYSTILKISGQTASSLAGEELRQNGYVKLPPFLAKERVQQISEKLDSLFADEAKTMLGLKERGLIRLQKSMLDLPEAEEFLHSPIVRDALRNYYGSSFKIFKCDIFRIFPVKNSEQEISSMRWHFDNMPRSLVKFMIYLTDTTKETGATAMLPKLISRKLQLEGFWDRHKSARFEMEILKNCEVIEGNAGTGIFFAPQFCIHRGTLPEKKWRDVIVFELYPTKEEFKELSEQQREEYSHDYDGYILNPFTGKSIRNNY